MSTTLARLLERLGPAALEPLATPAGLEVEIAEPVVLDVSEPVRVEPHAIVLAVGLRGDDPAIAGILTGVAQQGATAVVFKEPGSHLKDLAHDAGIAVLAADPAIPWRQIDGLISSAIEHRAGAGPSPGSAADLFALADAIAVLVGGAISIEDSQQRVLAYSNLPDQPIDEQRQQGILGRKVPDLPEIREIYSQLAKADGVYHLADRLAGQRPRIGIAVRAAGEVIGSIWAIEGERPLDADAEAALVDAGRIAALHLLRARTAQDVARSARADMVAALLEGHSTAGVAARRIGIEPSDAVQIVGFAIVNAGDADEATMGVVSERVVDLISVYCEAFRRRAACAAIGPVIYALLPHNPGARPLDTLGREVVSRAAKSLGVQVVAAVSTQPVAVHELPGMRTEIDRALAVLATDVEHRNVVTLEEVRHQSVLLEIGRILEERPDLQSASLQAMREVDAQKGTAHVATLRAYFESLGDVMEAAERISVHQNTFRYRLRRVGEIFDLDLNDPDTRLLLWLQLRVAAT